jgi:hypothetical protein
MSEYYLPTNFQPNYSLMGGAPKAPKFTFAEPLGSAAQDDYEAPADLGSAITKGSALAALLPGVGTAVAGLGSLVGAGFQAYAGWKQAKLNEQAQKDNLAFMKQQFGEQTREFDVGTALTKQKMAEQSRVSTAGIELGTRQQSQSEKMGNAQIAMAQQQMADTKAQRAIDAQLTAISRVMLFMGTPETRQRMISVWQGGK